MSDDPVPAPRRPFWRDPFFLAFVAGAALVTLAAPRFRKVAPPTPVTANVPDIVLADQDGAPLGRAQLQGHVTLVGLVTERAPRASLAVTRALAELQPRFATARADVRVVLLDLDGRDAAARTAWLATAAPAGAPWRVAGGEGACAFADEVFSLPAHPVACASAWHAAQDARLALVDASGQVRGVHGTSSASLYETFERTLRACDLAP